MLKQVNSVLNIIIGSTIGVFLGKGIYVFWDYKNHSELYATQSAPWYTSILVCGILALITLIICFTIKFILHYWGKEL